MDLMDLILVLCGVFQIYNHVAEAEIVLMNTGLVGFNFKVVGMDPNMDPSKTPGKALVIPHTVSTRNSSYRKH